VKSSSRLCLFLALLFWAAAPAWAESSRDADELAAKVDQHLAARWQDAGAKPAPAAGDAEFLRRVSLDLTGTIPPVSEVRAFLANPAPDKRSRLIDRLLESPLYVSHFTNVWRAAWLGDGAEVDNLGLRPGFEAWLRARLTANVGYDRMVREILTSAPAVNPGGGILGEPRMAAPNGISPAAFYLVNENKPEKLAGSTSRLFLAVRLECAQCHNHPFAEWTREQFWEYAAFFAGAQGGGNRTTIAIPKEGKTVQARFPDGSQPNFKKGVSPRVVLADWATSADNPYFARAAVNRMWAHFFGVGLAEPVDDLLREPGKNELLDELARGFAEHQFDLKYLIRAIVSTRAYQLTSVATDPSQNEPRLFARMAVKALTTEQVIASLIEATGYQAPASRPRGPAGAGLLQMELGRSFAHQPGKPTEFQTSVPQALALMNGKFVNDATALERGGTLPAVAGAPFLDSRGRVETLYLAALGRKPTPEESARLVLYVERSGPGGDSDLALADVFWAILNSSEFALNH
jgi:Protein of unknown function (DUF1549)/Protein of unknown function (DUF1553)